ncbi:MAG TPA: hypothetical protein VGI66_10510 [Streptosporangiaceae bacterium]|jgi:hypothetical protein
MSFGDRLVLWLHIAVAIFTIGPLALAISSTPRYIRNRDVAILRYLTRITTIFTAGSLLVLVFGIIIGQLRHDFSHPWLTAAMTLFLVAIVLLVLVMRDQRSAIRALTVIDPDSAAAAQRTAQPVVAATATGPDEAAGPAAADPAVAISPNAAPAEHIASVERGRIAAMGGVVNLIWLVILVLMVWQP